ncbi:ankyrin repeat-containing domain protein [Trichoderma sp. SZMC 28015]
MGSPITMILLYFLLLRHAAADSGDDFSNNLFTDLSPLLALFGERVTMQFISQAMGLSDCIILAMAPLGIITIIVAAIRVGGPSWLKALIGRATENLAAAELELMSSTSNEVCELWNGNDVVRCAGSAPVWEFICLLPSKEEGGREVAEVPTNPKVKIMSLEDAQTGQTGGAPYMEEININLWNKLRGKQIQQTEDGHVQPDTQSTNPSSDEPNVIIIRNTRHAAPNISHNRYKNTGRGELYFAACLGVLLQIGVILYCGIITQFPRRASKFQKDGSPVGSYAFPLTTIGTVVLNIGMLICCRVVETRTKENAYRPTKKWRARMVWLQRETTVGDQEFKSFALYTGEDQPIVITSERKGPSGKPNTVNTAGQQQHNDETNHQTQGSQDNQTEGSQDNTGEIDRQRTSLELMTVVGTTISLVGFFAQFIGIRGMHWSASVASLVAILMMTAVRAWVRRGLAKPMYSELLRPGFELDWFADTLKNISSASWYNPDKKKGVQATTNQNSNDNEAQHCIERRRKLAKLAGCQGPVSKEAIAVTLAIEATMNLLGERLDREILTFSWDYKIENSTTNAARFQLTIKKQEENKWKANAGEIEAALSLRLFYDKSQQEAQSLARDIHKSDNPSIDDTWLRLKGEVPDMGIRILGPNTMRLLRQLDWWVPEDGPQIWKGKAEDVSPDDAENYDIAVGNILAGSTEFEIYESRVVGLDPRTLRSTTSSSSGTVISEGDGISNARDPVAVAQDSGITASFHSQLSFPYYHKPKRGKWKFKLPNESNEPDESNEPNEGDDLLSVYIKTLDPLEVLYAKDMFSTFMWAVVETLDGSIDGKTDVQTSQAILDKNEDSWRRLVLRNDNISRHSLAIQSSGLCSIHEAYISVILPLCMQQKLPEVDGIIDLVQSQTRELEAHHLWREAGEVYLQLSRHLVAFSVESYTYTRAIAALVAFRKALKKANSEPDLAQRLMENADTDLGHNLDLLCEFQSTRDDVRLISGHQDLFDLAERYRYLHEDYSVPTENEVEQKEEEEAKEAKEAKAKDIMDRTPLHYCAVFSHHPMFVPENENGAEIPLDEGIYDLYLKRIRRLIDNGTDINGCDIRGWTPLHYACHTGNASEHVARLLLEKGALVNVQGRDGTAPIHCAAIEGHFKIVQLLLEFGANIDILDGFGSTALHAAALKGSAEVFQCLFSQSRITRDKQGRTAIHKAAMVGFSAAIEYWVNGDNSKYHDVNSKDYDDDTPLRFAVEFGHGEFVKQLLNKLQQADINATVGNEKCTVLHIACGKGHNEIVKILLDKGADIEAVNAKGETPLLDAIRNQRQSTVEFLTERGAKLATALKVAVRTGTNPAIFEHLSQKEGKKVNDGEGTWEGTPLHWASDGIDNNPMIQHLINNSGAKIEAIDILNRTPLHRAVDNDKLANIRLLIGMGADKEARDDYGYTPLQLAAVRWYPDLAERQKCIRLLIELGALVNASDNRGWTPLHAIAVNETLADLIPELLEAGAEIDKVDENGYTPLHLAALYGCSQAIKALLENEANTEAVNKEEETPQMMNPEWWKENIPPYITWWTVSSMKLVA